MLKKFAKSFFIFGMAVSVSRFLGIFLLPIFTRIFTPEEFAVIDIIQTFVFFVSLFGILQLESAIARYYYEVDGNLRKKYISTAFWTTVVLSFFFVLIISLISNFLSVIFFKNYHHSHEIIIGALIIPFLNIFGFFNLTLRFEKKSLLFTLVIILQALLLVTFSVVFVLVFKWGVKGALWGQFIGFSCGSLFAFIIQRKHILFYWEADILKKLFSFGLPLVPAVCIGYANNHLTRIILVAFLPISEIGILSAAIKINYGFRIIENAFRLAWIPFFFSKLKETSHKEDFKRILNISVLVLMGILLIYNFISPYIISIFAGKAFAGSGIYLGILALNTCVLIIAQITNMGPVITKKTYFNAIIAAIGFFLNILLLYIFIPRFGLRGAALSLLASTFFMFIFGWIISEKLYPIRYFKIISMSALLVSTLVILITFFK